MNFYKHWMLTLVVWGSLGAAVCGTSTSKEQPGNLNTGTGAPLKPATNASAPSARQSGARETINGLSFYKATEHFVYYCEKTNIQEMEAVVQKLENGYVKVCADFNYNFRGKVVVEIYPDQDALLKYSWCPVPRGTLGVSGTGRIQVVRPYHEDAMYYQIKLGVLVHEFTHLVIAEINDDIPKWLDEGTCSFEGKDMGDLKYSIRFRDDLKGPIPTFSDLESDTRFADAKGFPFSFTLVEYLVDKYGFQKIVELIKSPGNFDKIFGRTKAQVWADWKDHLRGYSQVPDGVVSGKRF